MMRTLIVLALGFFMALVVYAGQTGYDRETQAQEPSPSRMIHETQVRGYDFSYRMMETVEANIFYRQTPYQLAAPPAWFKENGSDNTQLVLFITDSEGKNVADAKVKYRIMSPARDTLESGGFPMKGGYAAGVYCSQAGIYQIEAKIELQNKEKVFVDRFAFIHRPESVLN